MSQDLESKESEVQSRKKKQASGKTILIAASITLAAMAVAGGVLHAQKTNQYQSVFFPRTTINGIDASGKGLDEVKQLISAGVGSYQLTLQQRNGQEEVLQSDQFGLHTVFDGSLEEILQAQDESLWFLEGSKQKQYQIDTMIDYDKEKLWQSLKTLSCMDASKAQPAADAYLSEYQPGIGYIIVPETEGTEVDGEKLRVAAEDAIANMKESLSLEEADCYIKANILSTDPGLQALMDKWNRYVKATITYQLGDETLVLDGDTVHTWLVEDENGEISLDQEAIATYVGELAAKCNTYNKAKTLKTSYGQTVTITRGTYGWKVNQPEEVAQLTALLEAGESQTREPVYSQKAASYGEKDYGDTYVEINLTAQHLFFYQNGSLLVESDFVSGNLSRGWGTPSGVYPLTYKQRNAILKGEGYRTPVSYWMPFNGGIGMHDANWRSSFGGNIYKTSGSHGCINLPPSVAKIIYENISAGMPVLCYELSGTEKSGATTPKETAPATQAPPATQPPETLPQETTAVSAQPEETSPAPTQPEESFPVATETAPSPPMGGGNPGDNGPGWEQENTYSPGPGGPS